MTPPYLLTSYADLKARIEALGVHPELGPTGQWWGIEQNPHELATFLTAIAPRGIQSVLEIGTGYQAGLARFMTGQLGWHVTTVNIWQPNTPAPLAIQVIGDSTNPTIVEYVSGRYDLVIIDANHAYEYVSRDYANYAPMADKIVMFHDIAGLRDCHGVAQFWQEISRTKSGKMRAKFYEVIDTSEQRAGIGWVTK